ncbi:MAG: cellulase family glycosylhydrolase [Spirochaetaceae bacterium]|nr:cellulase family glycosylhydrolase [Spirochaetaceae bacterium]
MCLFNSPKGKKLPLLLAVLLIFSFFITSCSQLSLENSASNSARAAGDSLPDLPRMTGVNWFGFETDTYVPHGLWIRDYKSMLIQMKDLGFNTIRLPYSNEMLTQYPGNAIQINAYGVDPYTGEVGLNTDLEGLTSMEVMDKIIQEAGNLGLRIVLDNHSRTASGYMEETLWYTDTFSEEQWIADWVFIAEHYKDYDNVVAYDINNEPHGGYIVPGMKPPATWGFDLEEYGITDWKAAAERCSLAILEVDPDIFLVIQGVQDYEGSNYWWGSNHAGLRDYPITSLPKDRVIYSVHEYGPEVASQDWFTEPDFPANLPALWLDRFWFIQEEQLGGLYIGEIGITEESAEDPSSIPYQWITTFLQFAGKDVHFTVWSWNPNSGDTGGILQDDWVSLSEAKYNLFKPYLEGSEPIEDDTTAPGVPSGLNTADIGTTWAKLSWNDVSDNDLAGYRIYRGSSEDSLTLLGSTVTSLWTDSTLSAETSYFYGVSAYDSSGNESAVSSVISLTTEEALPVTADLSLQLQISDSAASTSTLGLKIRLVNDGTSGVDLSGVTLRYYLTNENSGGMVFNCDYAGGPIESGWDSITALVQGSFTTISPSTDTADSYLEVSFDADAGTLKAGGFAEVQCRVTHSDWSAFNQTNDYSFTAESNLSETLTMTAFIDGVIVTGIAP